MADLALALFANLVSAGFLRGYGNIGRRIATRKSIIKTLKGHLEPPTRHAGTQGFHLISTLLGDKYNDNIVKLFNTMIVDGFAERIVQLSSSTMETKESLKELFVTKYRDILEPIEIDKRSLFDAILISVEFSVASVFQDPRLAKLVTDLSKENAERLTSIAKNIENLAQKHAPPDYDEGAFSAKIAKIEQVANRDIFVETNRGRKRYAIDKIFIKSRLGNISEEGPDPLPLFLETEEDDSGVIPYPEFITSFRRAVVLGDPGGGKSTLCQSICYDLSKSFNLASRHIDRQDIDYSNAKIPLKVILRDYEKDSQRSGLGIVEYIIKDIENKTGERREMVAHWLESSLSLGKIVLIFDGIDEVLDVANRRKYVQRIEDFCHAWEAVPVLCTSRLVGYGRAPLSNDFVVYGLTRFSRSEAKEYTLSLISLIEGRKKEHCGEQADTFIAQTDDNAADLRQNPLMLGLMVWLYIAQGHVPRHKAAIYSECAILMFEKWDKDRGIRADIPDDFDLMELFSYLAGKIFGNKELEGGVGANWLDGVMFEFFERWYENKAKARNAATRLREFVTGRSWVMTDVGPGKYAFTHRTFLEYFFARGISAKYDSVKSILNRLKAKITAREWDVICHLAVQSFCYQNSRRSEECVDALLKLSANNSLGDEKSQNTLLFLAHAVEYLVLNDGYVRRVFRVLLESARPGYFVGTALRAAPGAFVAARFRSSNEDIFLEEADRTLTRLVAGVDKVGVSGFIELLLAGRSVGPDSGRGVSIIQKLISQSERKLTEVARKDIVTARQVLLLYNDCFEELLDRYGDHLITGIDFGTIGVRTSYLHIAMRGNIDGLKLSNKPTTRDEKVLSLVVRRIENYEPIEIRASDIVEMPVFFGYSVKVIDGNIKWRKKVSLKEQALIEYQIMLSVELDELRRAKRQLAIASNKKATSRNRVKVVKAFEGTKRTPLFDEWAAGKFTILKMIE